jgi:Zn-dependent M28 family amino/carboxypeptidase
VKTLVDRVSASRFSTDLTALAGMHSRLSTSAGYRAAVKMTSTTLDALGYVVRKQRVSVNGKPSYNVIADRAGTDPAPRRQIVVTAHLDSINWENGPAAAAPGADDNGSGAAGILEMAHVFAGIGSKLDLRFVLFGGEEQGLFGSKHLVANITAADRTRIRTALNMDMIGSTNTAARTVLLEGSPISVAMMDALEAAAETYTGLAVERSLHPFNSDNVSFIEKGIPGVLTIEGADSSNERVHSARDTLAHVDVQLAVEILRMNVGFVAEAIGVA